MTLPGEGAELLHHRRGQGGDHYPLRLIASHPQVYLPVEKEPAFFCDEQYFQRGSNWYLRTFFRGLRRRAQPRGGNLTLLVLWRKGRAEDPGIFGNDTTQIHRHLSRSGWSRAFLLLEQRTRRRRGPSSRDALRLEPERLAQWGPQLEQRGQILYSIPAIAQYAQQIRHYLQQFPSQHFLYLLTEDLADFPTSRAGGWRISWAWTTTRRATGRSAATTRLCLAIGGFTGGCGAVAPLKELIKPFLPRQLRYRIKMAAIGRQSPGPSPLRPWMRILKTRCAASSVTRLSSFRVSSGAIFPHGYQP